jgi:hypothetical protein
MLTSFFRGDIREKEGTQENEGTDHAPYESRDSQAGPPPRAFV